MSSAWVLGELLRQGRCFYLRLAQGCVCSGSLVYAFVAPCRFRKRECISWKHRPRWLRSSGKIRKNHGANHLKDLRVRPIYNGHYHRRCYNQRSETGRICQPDFEKTHAQSPGARKARSYFEGPTISALRAMMRDEMKNGMMEMEQRFAGKLDSAIHGIKEELAAEKVALQQLEDRIFHLEQHRTTRSDNSNIFENDDVEDDKKMAVSSRRPERLRRQWCQVLKEWKWLTAPHTSNIRAPNASHEIHPVPVKKCYNATGKVRRMAKNIGFPHGTTRHT